MSEALLPHWPEYLMEASLLGGFMIVACMVGTLLEHPNAPGRRAIRSAFARRALMGLAMGLTAVGLIHSPWGQQSGAHMNPATTLTFFLRGKVATFDAILYVAAQFAGGVAVAWIAELVIAFGMMFMVLYVSNDAMLTPYTGPFAGALVALYITFEAPLSGMSLNPARTFGSALVSRHWKAFWIYLTAPVAGMLLASAAYAVLPLHNHVYCAKFDHCNNRRCIFQCEFDQLRKRIDSTNGDRQ